jgi:hypothetical protein
VTKKELFLKIIRPSILTGLVAVYQLNASFLSEKQETLVAIISEDLYNNIGHKFSLKDLQERYRELYGTANAVQEN